MLRFTNIDHKPTRLPPVYGYRTHPILPLQQALAPIISKIDQLEDFIKIAKTECYFPSEHGLTRDESAAIYLYTMDWGAQSLYRVLNGVLREKDRSVLVSWHGYLKLFDTALRKLPSLQISLWRGIDFDVSKNYRENDELTWWCFSSCSSTVKVVKNFLGSVSTLFMIEAKNGKAISAYSNFPEENEVILPLGTRLRVVGNALDHASLNVIHLREITDENIEHLTSSVKSMNVSSELHPDLKNEISKSDSKVSASASASAVKTLVNGNKYDATVSILRAHICLKTASIKVSWSQNVVKE